MSPSWTASLREKTRLHEDSVTDLARVLLMTGAVLISVSVICFVMRPLDVAVVIVVCLTGATGIIAIAYGGYHLYQAWVRLHRPERHRQSAEPVVSRATTESPGAMDVSGAAFVDAIPSMTNG